MANLLNEVFRNLDYSVFLFMHNFAVNTNNFFTPLMKVLAALGVKGWFFITLLVILLLFRKTRRAATSGAVALIIGFVIVNIIVKNIVQRPRPYCDDSMPYWDWRLYVYPSGYLEPEYSFPSGHVNETVVVCLGLMINIKSKWKYLMLLGIAIMCFSRIYLFAHYFTDIIGGLLFGTLAAFFAHLVDLWFRKILEKYKDTKIIKFYLNFDIIGIFS